MHKNSALGLTILVAGAFLGFARSSDSPLEVADLIQRLGSPKFAEREKAQKALEEIGVQALEALQKASQSTDLEIRRRAGDLARRVEEKKLNRDVLTPKKVHLKLHEVPLQKAIDELSKQSGYLIQVQGDRTLLSDISISLDTGLVTFWEALDQICLKGNLSDGVAILNLEDKRRPLPAVKGIRGRIAPMPAPAIPVPAPVPPPGPPVPDANEGDEGPVAQPPAPVAAPPPNVGGGGWTRGQAAPTVPSSAHQIILKAGESRTFPTSYHGATRVRLLPMEAKGEKDLFFALEVVAEPRLQNFRVDSPASIERAVDDLDQDLLPGMDAPGKEIPNEIHEMAFIAPMNPQPNLPVPLRLQRGPHVSRMLKELKGSLSAEVDIPHEKLFEVADILQAAGKKSKKGNFTLEIKSVQKLKNGQYQIRLHQEGAGGNNNPFGGGMIIGGGGKIVIRGNVAVNGVFLGSQADGSKDPPTLLDVEGKPYQMVSSDRSLVIENGKTGEDWAITYQAQPGQSDPATLIRYGSRTVKVTIPFSFRDVAIP